jgi:hypothetical protein
MTNACGMSHSSTQQLPATPALPESPPPPSPTPGFLLLLQFLMPTMNPDGFAKRQRYNAGTMQWSLALLRLLQPLGAVGAGSSFLFVAGLIILFSSKQTARYCRLKWG